MKDFEDGMISPWFDESQNGVKWTIADFTSSSPPTQPDNNFVVDSKKYLRLVPPVGSFGVAEFRSPVFTVYPGDIVTFYFWIRSKFKNFNNLEVNMVWNSIYIYFPIIYQCIKRYKNALIAICSFIGWKALKSDD